MSSFDYFNGYDPGFWQEEDDEPRVCMVCGKDSDEVTIVDELCSVHTCKVCQFEGYATKFDGAILCDECEREREKANEKSNL